MKLSIAWIQCVLVILICSGCKPHGDPVARYAEAMTLVKRLAERDAEHPIQADVLLSRSKDADRYARTEAAERTRVNCEDFARLHSLIDRGRKLADYAPLETLGYWPSFGKDRFLVVGVSGYVIDRGSEPFAMLIEVNSAQVITGVHDWVSAR